MPNLTMSLRPSPLAAASRLARSSADGRSSCDRAEISAACSAGGRSDRSIARRSRGSSRILASSGPSRSSGASRRMVMSVAWEAPSRVPSVIIVASSSRLSGDRSGGLFDVVRLELAIPAFEFRRLRVVRWPRGRGGDDRRVSVTAVRQLPQGGSEVVALGAETVGLATTQRGLFFKEGANRSDSSQIRAINAEGNHLSQGRHGQDCCQYRRTTYPSYCFRYNIVVSNR